MATENFKIIVKPDYQGYTVTGYTGTQIVGSGATVVTSTGVNPVVYNIYSPVDTGVTQSQFSSYTGATEVVLQGIEGDIVYLSGQTDNKLDTNTFSGYTGTTALLIGSKLDTSIFNTYAGTTAPLTYAAIIHTHSIANVTGLQTALDGKSSTGHTHTGVYAPVVHTHPYSGLTGLPQLFDGDYNSLSNKPTLFTGNTFVASGGTVLDLTGDVLTIYSPTGGTSATWGLITGALSGQTDLMLKFADYVDLNTYSYNNSILSGVLDNLTTGVTANAAAILTKLDTTVFNTYSGTTVPNLLAGKSDTGHTHAYSAITSTPDLTGYQLVSGMSAYTQTGTTASLQSAFTTYTGTTAPQSFLPITGLTGYWTSAQTESYVTGLGYITGYTVTASDVTGVTATLYVPKVKGDSTIIMADATININTTAGGNLFLGNKSFGEYNWFGYADGDLGIDNFLNIDSQKFSSNVKIDYDDIFYAVPLADIEATFTDTSLINRHYADLRYASITGSSFTGNTFTQSGATVITLVDDNVNIFSPVVDLSQYQPISGMSAYLTGITAGDITGTTAALYVPKTQGTSAIAVSDNSININTTNGGNLYLANKSDYNWFGYADGDLGIDNYINIDSQKFSSNVKIDYDDIFYGVPLEDIEATLTDTSLINKHYADLRYMSITGGTTGSTAYTFTQSGATIITQVGDNVNIYTPVVDLSPYLTGVTCDMISGCTANLVPINSTGSTRNSSIARSAAGSLLTTVSSIADATQKVDDVMTDVSRDIKVNPSGGNMHVGNDYSWLSHINADAGTEIFIAISDYEGIFTGSKIDYNDAFYGVPIEDIEATFNDTSLINKHFADNHYAPHTPTIVSVTGTTALDASHANKIIEANGTFTITLPDAMVTGMRVDIVNVGSGTITLAASTTLQSDGTKLATQYTAASAYHRGGNTWIAFGKLTT
jgi:hypothetical protein